MNLQQKAEKTPTQTYLQIGANKLRALCDVMGFEEKTQEAFELFRYMFSPWGETPIDPIPRKGARLSTDSTPFDFSLAFCGQRSELRVAVEPQGADGTLESQQKAGYDQLERIARDFNLSLDRIREIEALFLPENPKGWFAIMLTASLGPNRIGEPDFQVYFDCQAQGKEKSPLIVEEALRRLGFGRAWSAIAEVIAQCGSDKVALRVFSLDLTKDKTARVKLYLRYNDTTAQNIETCLSIASKYVPGDATELCEAIVGHQGPFNDYTIGNHYAFVEGDEERPSGATFFVEPVLYLPNDRVICDRICAYLAKNNMPYSLYEDCQKAMTNRPLEESVGIQNCVSLKREKGERRVTIYFAPQGYKVYP